MPRLLHDGCNLEYRLAGTGPRVLLIQGVGVHGDGWLPQADNLQSDFTLLSFDNRGMASSQPVGVKKLTIGQMVDDARALMDHLGWDDAHVVGHSMGGHIAAGACAASARAGSEPRSALHVRPREGHPAGFTRLPVDQHSNAGRHTTRSAPRVSGGGATAGYAAPR